MSGRGRGTAASPAVPLRRALLDRAPERSYRILFILENSDSTWHYVANLERSLRGPAWQAASIIRVDPPTGKGLAARLKLTSWSRQHRAEAVFIHLTSTSLLNTHWLRRMPSVLSVEATARNQDRLRATSQGGRRAWPLIPRSPTVVARRAYRSASALVAWSYWVANSLINDYGASPQKVHVIRPGVDLNEFRPLGKPRPESPMRILFIGHNFVRCGGPDLLAAVGRLSGAAELDIVTTSEVGPRQAGLRCRVHREMGTDSSNLIDLYQHADVLVLPSSAGPSSSAAAGALACGLPIVGPPRGVIPELIVDGVNGLLVPPGQPALLGRALQALIESPALRRAMSEKSLELARKEHDADFNNRLILQVLVEALSGGDSQASSQ